MGGGEGPDLVRFRASLERTPRVVCAMVEGLGDDDARWRVGSDPDQ